MRAPLLWLMACTPPVELAPVAEAPTRTCACEPDPACPPEVADVALAGVRDAEDALFAVRWVLDDLRAARAIATRSASETMNDRLRSILPDQEFQGRLALLDRLSPSPDLTSAALGLTPVEVSVSSSSGARAALPTIDAAIAVALARVRTSEAALAVARDEASLANPACALPAPIPPAPEADAATWEAARDNAQAGLDATDVARGVTEQVGEMLRRMRALAVSSGQETTLSTRRQNLNRRFQAWILAVDQLSRTATYGGISITNGANTLLEVQTAPSESLVLSMPDLRASALGLDSSEAVDTYVGGLVAVDAIDTAKRDLRYYARMEASATRALRGARDGAFAALEAAAGEASDVCVCEVELACPAGDAAVAAAPILSASARLTALQAGWGPLTEMRGLAVRNAGELVVPGERVANATAYALATDRLRALADSAPELDPDGLGVVGDILWANGRMITAVDAGLDELVSRTSEATVDVRLARAEAAALWPRCPLPELPETSGYTMDTSWTSVAEAVEDAEEAVDLVRDALAQVDDRLVRMREIAVSTVDPTISGRARRRFQAEFEDLTAEIEDLAWGTAWGGIRLADGSNTAMDVQVGADNMVLDRLTISFPDLRATTLGVDSGSVSMTDPELANASLTNLDNARDMVRGAKDGLVASDEVLDMFTDRANGRGRVRTPYGDW